jgi:3-hydroxyacyl-[acyl-carrier-protein] dehydratase
MNPGLRPIKEMLPHREPFLFIDEIVDLTERTVIARSQVRGDDPHFRGHYPGKPIMPGVLLCETVLQAGAYLMATNLALDATVKGVPVVSRMNKVKFKRMVKPGDVLEIRAELERSMMGAHFMSGSIRSNGKVVMTLEFAVYLADEASEEEDD